MASDFRKLVGFSLLTASFVLVGVGIYQCGRMADPEQPDERAAKAPTGDKKKDKETGVDVRSKTRQASDNRTRTPLRSFPGPSPYESIVAPPNRDGPTISFVNAAGEGVPTNTVVGAPGLWPSPHLRSNVTGAVTLPAPEVSTLRGETIEYYEILARAPSRRLAFWGDVHPERQKTYRLERAESLRIRVVGPTAEPVPETEVSIGRGPLGFVRLSGTSGDDGLIEFRSLPAGTYRVRVRKSDRWGRATVRHDVEYTDGAPVDGDNRDSAIWVTLRPADQASARLPDPSGEASFGESGSAAGASSEGDDDSLESRQRVQSTVRLSVQGLSDQTWRNSSFFWRTDSGNWQRGRLQRQDVDMFSWASDVEAATISFRIETADRSADKSFAIENEQTDATWRVDFSRRLPVYVVDASGSPLAGAKIFIWRNGALAKTTLSRGAKPHELTVPASAGSTQIRVAAGYGGIGEAMTRVTGDRERITLELNAPGMSLEWPGRGALGSQLASQMNAEFVESADGVQIDPLPEGWAAKQGVSRGAWILTAQSAGDSVALHVQHRGNHRVVSVPLSAHSGDR